STAVQGTKRRNDRPQGGYGRVSYAIKPPWGEPAKQHELPLEAWPHGAEHACRRVARVPGLMQARQAACPWSYAAEPDGRCYGYARCLGQQAGLHMKSM